jgi:hypothetical protein
VEPAQPAPAYAPVAATSTSSPSCDGTG